VTSKVAEFAPPGTTREDGMWRVSFALLKRSTDIPPAGAGFESSTVHAVLILGVRVVRAHTREEMDRGAREGGAMVNTRGLLEEPREAVTVEV